MNFRIVAVLLLFPGLILAAGNPPTARVEVTNTPETPVPVSIQNHLTTLDVNVTNDETAPVPVTIQNPPPADVLPISRWVSITHQSPLSRHSNRTVNIPVKGRMNIVALSLDPLNTNALSCFAGIGIRVTEGGAINYSQGLFDIAAIDDSVSKSIVFQKPIEWDYSNLLGYAIMLEGEHHCNDPDDLAVFSFSVHIENLN